MSAAHVKPRPSRAIHGTSSASTESTVGMRRASAAFQLPTTRLISACGASFRAIAIASSTITRSPTRSSRSRRIRFGGKPWWMGRETANRRTSTPQDPHRRARRSIAPDDKESADADTTLADLGSVDHDSKRSIVASTGTLYPGRALNPNLGRTHALREFPGKSTWNRKRIITPFGRGFGACRARGLRGTPQLGAAQLPAAGRFSDAEPLRDWRIGRP